MELRLLGPSEPFLERLRQQGIAVATPVNGLIILPGTGEALAAAVWKTAQECQVGVRSLTPARNSLEEIFLNAVRGESKNE